MKRIRISRLLVGLLLLVAFVLLLKERDSKDALGGPSQPDPVPVQDGTSSSLPAPFRREVLDLPVRLALRAPDGTALAQTWVRARAIPGGERVEKQTGPEGRIDLPAPGRWILEIQTSEDLRPLRCTLEAGPGVQELTLPEAAALVLEFRGRGGRPVRGVEAMLQPDEPLGTPEAGPSREADLLEQAFATGSPEPLQLLDEEATWRPAGDPDLPWFTPPGTAGYGPRRSDGEGRMIWMLLPPGTWRWRLLSSHPAVPVPAPEPWVRPGPEPGTLEAGPPPVGRSGPIPLQAGEVRRIEVPVFEGTGFTAVLAGYGPEVQESEADLFRVEDQQAEGLPQAFRDTIRERSTTPGADGRLTLQDLAPGRKRLTVWWRTLGGHLWFVETEFEIHAGEFRDLGLLRPFDEQTVRAEIFYEDPEGRRVEVARAVSGGGPAGFLEDRLLVSAWRPENAGGLRQSWFHIPVPLDIPGTWTLHLPPVSRLDLRGWFPPPGPSSGWSLDPSRPRPDLSLPAPLPERVEIAIPVHRSCRLQVLLEPPPEVLPEEVEGLLVTRSLQHVPLYSVSLRAVDPGQPLEFPGGASVPCDPEWLFFRSVRRDGPDLCALLHRPRLDAGPLRVTLQEGCRIEGILVDGSGSPVAGASLTFALDALLPPEAFGSHWSATTDAEGRFRIEGVPRGAVLRWNPNLEDVFSTDFERIPVAAVPGVQEIRLVAR